jgi:hypothetical protein
MSKSEMQQTIREILATYKNDVELSKEDELRLIPILSRHRKWLTKSSGYIHIEIRENKYSGREFCLVKSDGVEHISWIQSITPLTEEEEYAKECTSVFRNSIYPQIVAYKKANPANRCGICNGKITDLHVDHILPFSVIVQAFRLLYPITPSIVQDQDQLYFTDKVYTEKWVLFHKEHATLRNTCASCNLSRGADRPSKVASSECITCKKDITETVKKYKSVIECWDCKYPNPMKGKCMGGCGKTIDPKYKKCYGCAFDK